MFFFFIVIDKNSRKKKKTPDTCRQQLPLVSAGEVALCPAGRGPWCCDAGERFRRAAEEPAPSQTGEPRAGAQGEAVTHNALLRLEVAALANQASS